MKKRKKKNFKAIENQRKENEQHRSNEIQHLHSVIEAFVAFEMRCI